MKYLNQKDIYHSIPSVNALEKHVKYEGAVYRTVRTGAVGRGTWSIAHQLYLINNLKFKRKPELYYN